ncbi:hypothetical protein A1O1_03295 [Capronia coronata CBS 617.96]|uniref:Trichothecene 3-O-acetyltransferase n=1 Tax=Capronia coronata CBS 617.96 TaxID=1182541 RepID=W9YLS2_9EURO|nr:uncharacterized protein A1O1_03295 [Capronia coronata CBS 617.96]EXJ90196.1 hypothetical protein A1O1_03295 [Capronia coronata CBS 617.96]
MVDTRFETFEVLPRDHESLPETTEYELSDIDQVLTGNHTTPCIVYPFTGDKDDFIKPLRTGLQNVLTCIPLVGGELLTKDGRLWVLRKNHEPIRLGVNHLDEDPDFPTYESLSAAKFPAEFFSANALRLTPPGSNLAGLRRDDGCPVAVFQANFIKGGLILTLPLHHCCGDAKSIDHTFLLWVNSTLAAANKAPMPTFHPSIDRTYFNATASLPSQEKLEDMKSKISGFSFHPIQPEPPSKPLNDPPKPPVASIKMYHFPKTSIEELKRICWPATGTGIDFVSSYDVVCALTWQAMTRARIPYLKPDLQTVTTEFGHPVNARACFNSVVPAEYFGNGFSMVATAPILISELIGTGGLAKAAQLIRRSVHSFDVDYIPNFLQVGHAVAGKEQIQWNWRPQNVVGTSWMSMGAMQAYDFGLGLPTAIRLPVPPFEGVLGVLPATRTDGVPEGFDVYVVLEAGCQERLTVDSDFGKYCSLIGA